MADLGAAEPFGRIFLATAGQVLATHQLTVPPAEAVPSELHDDFAAYHSELLSVLAESGVDVPPDALDLGTTYMIVRPRHARGLRQLSGPDVQTDALFDAMLAELAAEIGLHPT